MNKINSFAIYREYYDLITLLPSERKKEELAFKIMQYMFDDIKVDLDVDQMKIFNNLKRPLDKSKNKSKNASKLNQNEIKLKSNENQNEIKSKTHHDVNVIVNVNDNIYSFIENNFNRTLSPIEYEEVSTWQDNELTRYAIKQAIMNSACSIKYISRILENYSKKNIRTVQEAQKDEEKFKSKKNIKSNPEWLDKDIKENKATNEEIQELEEYLRR